MNTTTPYEKLMAEKLDQVPVPDMADSVWSSIGMQLDMGGDMPDQADDAPDRRSAPKFKGKGWYGFLGVMVVVSTLWWYYSHNQKSVPAPAVKESAPVADTINSIKKKNIDVPMAPVRIKKDTLLLNKVPDVGASIDSAAQQVLPPVKVDSSSLYKDWVPVPLFDSLSIKPRGRKPRGVKGITSDDYKISAEKNHN